jgi:arabinofuranosyltransferase
MKRSMHNVGIAVCLSILVVGCIAQTLGGTSFLTTRSHNDWGNDDAYISYHYAENLVDGKGLVFNPGERVEGYSNFLYVLLMALAFLVTSRDGVYFFSVFLNLIFAIGAWWVFAAHLRGRLGDVSALAGGLLFALCLPLWVAVASGMETCLVLLLYVGIWVVVERVASEPDSRHLVLLCILTALSVLARVDGFLPPGIAVLYLGLKRQRRAAVACALTLLATLGLQESWRLYYYHALLPTTYYVKIAGPLASRLKYALSQLSKIALFDGLFAYLLALAVALFEGLRGVFANRGKDFTALRFEAFFALCWITYWFYIGGDHFWDRFLVILFPMGIFALLGFLKEAANLRLTAFAVILVAGLQVGPPRYTDPRFRYVFNKYDAWVGVGKLLAETYPGQTLALAPIGKIPFFSGMYTMDMLGLVDPVIAHKPVVAKRFEPGHLKFDPNYILARHPGVIVAAVDEDGYMGYGMTLSECEQAGYHIQYLANTRRPPPSERIIDVFGMDEASVKRLMATGYDLAVLAKK